VTLGIVAAVDGFAMVLTIAVGSCSPDRPALPWRLNDATAAGARLLEEPFGPACLHVK